MSRVRLKVLQDDRGRDCHGGSPAYRCRRCALELGGYGDATDCRYCDRLCPVWGTHGHLWNGDEEEARELLSIVLDHEETFEHLIDKLLLDARCEDVLLHRSWNRGEHCSTKPIGDST